MSPASYFISFSPLIIFHIFITRKKELWLEQELPVTKGRGQSHFLQGWGGSCMQARGVSSPWTLWKVGEAVDPNSRHNPGRQMGVLRLLYLFIQQTFTECPLCARHWSRCWWYTSNRKGKEKIPWFQGVDCQLISCKHLLIALPAGASALGWAKFVPSCLWRGVFLGVRIKLSHCMHEEVAAPRGHITCLRWHSLPRQSELSEL